MPSRKRKLRAAQSKARHDAKRVSGFHCAWCPTSSPRNERFVPNYYRAPATHRRDPWMCFACHLEGRNSKRKRGGQSKPHLTPETLEQFWREDVSDSPYLAAAMDYFGVDEATILSVTKEIRT